MLSGRSGLGSLCGEAPFQMPTSGLIGFLWDDLFRVGHRHQGIDIFGGGEVKRPRSTPLMPGYLTRLPDWKSSLIIRIPQMTRFTQGDRSGLITPIWQDPDGEIDYQP